MGAAERIITPDYMDHALRAATNHHRGARQALGLAGVRPEWMVGKLSDHHSDFADMYEIYLSAMRDGDANYWHGVESCFAAWFKSQGQNINPSFDFAGKYS